MHNARCTALRSGHGALRMRGSSFATCPRRWRLRFRNRLKHSMRGYKNFISILRQSTMCAAIRQSVAMHTMKRRFSGSKQRMIISKLNSTTRNWPSACCPPRNNDAAGAPRPRRPPPQPCLLSRRRQEREPLRGPHARMTRRTTTRLFLRHPVPGREGAKQGRRFYVPKQRFCTYCAYFAYLLYSALQTYYAYFAYKYFGIFCVFCIFCIFVICFMLCRYILRSSQPVYGFWYYFMIHRAIGIHLQKILPKLVPKTDAEVDALLDCKLRVYVVHILHILHI